MRPKMRPKQTLMSHLGLGDVFVYTSNSSFSDKPLRFVGFANAVSQNGRGFACLDIMCLNEDSIPTSFESSNPFFTLEEVLFNMDDSDIVNDKARGQVIDEHLCKIRPEYFI